MPFDESGEYYWWWRGHMSSFKNVYPVLDLHSMMLDDVNAPMVLIDGPLKFFESLEASSHDVLSWRGELYFELHRGTYTSHALNKRCNRKYPKRQLGVLWKDVLLFQFHDVIPSSAIQLGQLDVLWKDVLLFQFHDVIPGSAIQMVFDFTKIRYSQMLPELAELRTSALAAVQRSSPYSTYSTSFPAHHPTDPQGRGKESSAAQAPPFGQGVTGGQQQSHRKESSGLQAPPFGQGVTGGQQQGQGSEPPVPPVPSGGAGDASVRQSRKSATGSLGSWDADLVCLTMEDVFGGIPTPGGVAQAMAAMQQASRGGCEEAEDEAAKDRVVYAAARREGGAGASRSSNAIAVHDEVEKDGYVGIAPPRGVGPAKAAVFQAGRSAYAEADDEAAKDRVVYAASRHDDAAVASRSSYAVADDDEAAKDGGVSAAPGCAGVAVGAPPPGVGHMIPGPYAFNSLSFEREEVVEVAAEMVPEGAKVVQYSYKGDGTALALLSIPPLSFAPVMFDTHGPPSGEGTDSLAARPVVAGDDVAEDCVQLTLTAGEDGELYVMGNKMHEDIPLFWDAWDVEITHLEKCWEVGPTTSVTMLETGPLRAALQFKTQLSPTSTLVQTIFQTVTSPMLEFETTVEWNENRRMLKVEFPWALQCDVATYETQFGAVQRPTHQNTSWDWAKFEVCGHRSADLSEPDYGVALINDCKFADLSEPDYGVALLNDCKYGHATHGNTMRLSLLRSPKCPDATTDMGTHTFKYAVRPHKLGWQSGGVVAAALAFNQPLLLLSRHPWQAMPGQPPATGQLPTGKATAARPAASPEVRMPRLMGEAVQGMTTSPWLQHSSTPMSTKKFSKMMHACRKVASPDSPSSADVGGNEEHLSELVFDYSPFKIITLKLYVAPHTLWAGHQPEERSVDEAAYSDILPI
eukprot:gene19351-26000_t